MSKRGCGTVVRKDNYTLMLKLNVRMTLVKIAPKLLKQRLHVCITVQVCVLLLLLLLLSRCSCCCCYCCYMTIASCYILDNLIISDNKSKTQKQNVWLNGYVAYLEKRLLLH